MECEGKDKMVSLTTVLQVNAILKNHEKEKKRAYNSRIMNVDHKTSTLVVFSLKGGEVSKISMFYKQIAQKIVDKTKKDMKKLIH